VAQFDIYANPVKSQREDIPWCVDIQSDLLSGLSTRLVLPLAARKYMPPESPRRLCPQVQWEGESYVALPHMAAPFRTKDLASPRGNLRSRANELIAAVDAVMSGI